MTVTINASTSTGLVQTADLSGALAFQTNSGTTAVTIDTSQNVGIGTSSPSEKLYVHSSGDLKARVYTSGTTVLTHAGLILKTGSYEYLVQNLTTTASSAGALRFYDITAGAERMRIDSSGAVWIGTTGNNVTNGGFIFSQASGYGYGNAIIGHITGTSSGTNFAEFRYNNGTIGQIAQSGTTNVNYNTSSDYRLKENIAPMTGALTTVAKLKPCTYKWKPDGNDGQGFIAHELAEVVPDCVTGAKDAVDEEGNPKYQGVDTSYLVATLTAAIQELKAINDTQAETINALTARIVALESK